MLDVKESHGKQVVVLESGINHLGGMSGLRRLPPLAPHLLHEDDDAPRTEAMITGPLCTPLDTWARSASLPRVVPGDVLAVPNVGAYGLYASLLAFLGHPLPTEVVVQRHRIVPLGERGAESAAEVEHLDPSPVRGEYLGEPDDHRCARTAPCSTSTASRRS